MLSAPALIFFRVIVKLVALFLPSAAHSIANLLPCSVPGYGDAQLLPLLRQDGKKSRIGVVGGGIAGCACAYSLAEAGYEVVVYEARERLGGNAKREPWQLPDGDMATSAVAVVAHHDWQHNYRALLRKVGVETVPYRLPFWVHCSDPELRGDFWHIDPDLTRKMAKAEPGAVSLHDRFADDFKKWDVLVGRITKCNNFFAGLWYSEEPSFYKLTYLNPMNYVSIHTLSKLHGISQDWWDIMVTGVHATSFMTNDMTTCAATVAEAIDEIVPITKTPRLNTWKWGGDGIEKLFAALTKDVTTHIGTRVRSVECNSDGTKTLTDEFGRAEQFDRIVFACPSNAVGNMLKGHNWLEDTLLRTSEYADDLDFQGGHLNAIVHEDDSVLHPPARDAVLNDACNYIDIRRNKEGKWEYENTYSFKAQTFKTRDMPLDKVPPMLITHGLFEEKTVDSSKQHRSENHARAHTIYSTPNLITMGLMPFIQGRRGCYFVSNYTIPGNCQDLSSLSGFCAAAAIGAPYPMRDTPLALRDFGFLRNLMGM